ncbi:MAG TPA: hypothetical protein VN258_07275 [Mobilitalea sp.]|nr:hypothetical protein [Mobilitalea sp.]
MAKHYTYVYIHPTKGKCQITDGGSGKINLNHGQIVFFEESYGTYWQGSTYDPDRQLWFTHLVPIFNPVGVYGYYPNKDGVGLYSLDSGFTGTFIAMELANYKQYGDAWRYAPAAGSIYSVRTQYQNADLYTVSGDTYTKVGALNTTGQKVIIGGGQSYVPAQADTDLFGWKGALQRMWGYIQPSGQVVETSGYYIQNSVLGSMVDAYTLNTK